MCNYLNYIISNVIFDFIYIIYSKGCNFVGNNFQNLPINLIILFDEPTAFLDAGARIEIFSLLHRLASEQGKSILIFLLHKFV